MAHASGLVAQGSWLLAKRNLARGPPAPGPRAQVIGEVEGNCTAFWTAVVF